ncbi:hypothetical protein FQN49_000490 [Arthroderma sp. PD_2]|nr:hypothetical protein FQN49_000490 [Arthroderma sp. PD_2]
MRRWHDPGCQQPDVISADGTPRCNTCSVQMSKEDIDAEMTPLLPVLHLDSRSHMNLTWPSAVSYTRAETCPNSVEAPSLPEARSSKDPLAVGKSKGLDSFPEITAGDEIRLLRLLPSQDDGPIHGNIELLSLKSTSVPAYQALSYTSSNEPGDTPLRNCPVYIGPYWDVIYVTKNCEDALRASRYQGTELPVWVDLVCIDQQNVDEKTQRVRLMSDIYTKAYQGTIFVGNPSSDSDVALKLLNILEKGSAVSRRVAATEEKSQSAFKSLFQRRCFSSLWVICEIALARRLKILCGQRSEDWPSWSSLPNALRGCDSSQLLNPKSRSEEIRTDLPRMVHHALRYECSDPRDKIFAVFGLLYGLEIRPDYNLPIEIIYTGVTAYLLKNCLDFWPLNLLGTGKRGINLPSWVPDWSQPIGPPISIDLESLSKIEIGADESIRVDFPFIFDNSAPLGSESSCELEISVDGSLIIPAIKLCEISRADRMFLSPNHQPVIAITRGVQGTVLISLAAKEYQIGNDSIFLLNKSNRPVILRSHAETNSYSFVSACGISLGQPINGAAWNPPFELDGRDLSEDDTMKIPARLSDDDNKAILGFHSGLLRLCGVEKTCASEATDIDPASSARLAFLDFGVFALTNYRDSESLLRRKWYSWHEKLRWMFRDQTAIWKYMQDIRQGSQDGLSGLAHDSLRGRERFTFRGNYAMKLSHEYEWNMYRFCWSFLRPPGSTPKALDDSWNPIYKIIKSNFDDICSWMKVTEDLINVMDHSREVLGGRWDVFPGMDQPRKWRSRWKKFSEARGEYGQLPESLALDPEYYWDWSEFERCLRQRESLLAQTLLGSLRVAVNPRVKSHLVLNALGLKLDPVTTVRIV